MKVCSIRQWLRLRRAIRAFSLICIIFCFMHDTQCNVFIDDATKMLRYTNYTIVHSYECLLLAIFCLDNLKRVGYFLDGKQVSEGGSSSWIWASTQEKIRKTSWGTNEPSGAYGENCIALHDTGKWTDISCTNPHPALCYLPIPI